MNINWHWNNWTQ